MNPLRLGFFFGDLRALGGFDGIFGTGVAAHLSSGAGFARCRSEIQTQMKTSDRRSLYLLLLRQPARGPHPTPGQMREIMARFEQWMSGIHAAGALVSSHGLKTKGKTLRGRRGQNVSDGPYAETKEIVGGYVLVRVRNQAQALRLARGCPGLDYRMAVEVRAVKH